MSNHGGQRKGAGRKPAPYDKKMKSFRPPSPEAWEEFLSYLTGDLVEDFEIVLNGLRLYAAQQNVHSTGGKAPASE